MIDEKAKLGLKEFSKKLNIKTNVIYFLKWGIFSVIIGVVVGFAGASFAHAINFATSFWQKNTYTLYLLPIFGLLIALLYHIMKADNPRGTNWVIDSISSGEPIPLKMAPTIYIASFLTHLGSGSAGREGAALQIGGSIGNFIGRKLKLGQSSFSDRADINIAVMCGMAACFSALFGTPIAASIFSMEIFTIGVLYHAALIPCLLSSYVAVYVAKLMHTPVEKFILQTAPHWNFKLVLYMILLAALTAIVAIIFSIAMHKSETIYKKYFKNTYIRIVVSAILFIILTIASGSRDYNGGGFWLIERSMKGDVGYEAFLLKILFTAVVIGGGFKGGEIVPTFVIGATFGCAFAKVFGLPFDLCTACGMIACFVGVTNCPIASIFMGIEFCGSSGINYYAIVVGVSFVLSGYYGLYSSQKFAYSKTEARYVGADATAIRKRRHNS